jgi:hypothetical protein
VTRKLARQWGFPKEDIGSYEYYTLDADDAQYPGLVERTAIRCIANPAANSLVIRHHRSNEEAGAYLSAVFELGHDDTETICRTPDGIFTLLHRPTHPRWPGPLIIYVAIVPGDNLFFGLEEVWAVAVAPDGAVAEFDDFMPDAPPIIIAPPPQQS